LLGVNPDGKTGCNESALNPVITALTGYQWIDLLSSLQNITPVISTQTLASISVSTGSIEKTVACVNTLVLDNKTGYQIFSVQPDPAHNEIKILSKELIEHIEIINELGQLKEFLKMGDAIDISNLSPGIYFVRLNNQYYRKLIKD